MRIDMYTVLDVPPIPPFDLLADSAAVELFALVLVGAVLMVGAVYARRRGANKWVVSAVALTVFFAVLLVLDWSAWTRNRAKQQSEQRRRFETFSTSTGRPAASAPRTAPPAASDDKR